MRDGEAPRPRARLAPPLPAGGTWPRFGLIGSAALHAVLAALLIAVWIARDTEPGAPEPTSAFEFRDTETPQQAAESSAEIAEIPSVPAPPNAVPAEPPPAIAALPPSPTPPAPLDTVPPPGPLVLAPPPAPLVPPPSSPALPAPPFEAPEATTELALPLPPPPQPPAPTRPTAPRERVAQVVPAPPRQAPSGLWLPNGFSLNPSSRPSTSAPAPPRQAAARAPTRLPVFNVPSVESGGGGAIETEVLDIEGVDPTDAWFTAFRIWMRDNWRYPPDAAALGQFGENRITVVADPSGRVLIANLVSPSGYILLDTRSRTVFRGAQLPRFPAGADPNGVTLRLRLRYVLVRR